MNRITILIVACCLVVATAAGCICSALDGATFAGASFYSFVSGMIAIVSGGTGVMIPSAWVVDHFSAAARRERSCL